MSTDQPYGRPTAYRFDGVKLQGAPRQPLEFVQAAKDFSFRPEDVLVVTYPKSGTIWTEIMTCLILNGADVEEANSKPLRDRSRFLEMKHSNWEHCGAQLAENDPSPRLLKTHLPEHIMRRSVAQGKPRVIVVMRNPKDLLVSYYHWHRNLPDLPTPNSWEVFFGWFRDKELYYGDLFEWMVGWWKHGHEDNFLFLKFEDMKRDPRRAVEQIAQHCHVTLTSEQLERIVTNTDFPVMRSCDAVKSVLGALDPTSTMFLRKGKVGDWRNYFSPQQAEYVDAQCRQLLHPMGLVFSCE